MKRWMVTAVLTLAAAAAGPARAARPAPEEMQARAAKFFAEEPLGPIEGELTLVDAMCAQRLYVAELAKRLGGRAGLKAGFASKASQEAFGIREPARGVLLASMLLSSGATVSADLGVRTFFEADLLIRVKDEGINDAGTALEAAAHIESIIPFIELPDIMYAEDVELTGPLLVAANMGARAGVMGPEVPMRATSAFLNAFRNMTVTMTDENGNVLVATDGSALLGDPMNVVMWLLGDLRKTGEKLVAGDVVSLGSLGKPFPLEAGKRVTVSYVGISDRPATVHVSFE